MLVPCAGAIVPSWTSVGEPVTSNSYHRAWASLSGGRADVLAGDEDAVPVLGVEHPGVIGRDGAPGLLRRRREGVRSKRARPCR